MSLRVEGRPRCASARSSQARSSWCGQVELHRRLPDREPLPYAGTSGAAACHNRASGAAASRPLCRHRATCPRMTPTAPSRSTPRRRSPGRPHRTRRPTAFCATGPASRRCGTRSPHISPARSSPLPCDGARTGSASMRGRSSSPPPLPARAASSSIPGRRRSTGSSPRPGARGSPTGSPSAATSRASSTSSRPRRVRCSPTGSRSPRTPPSPGSRTRAGSPSVPEPHPTSSGSTRCCSFIASARSVLLCPSRSRCASRTASTPRSPATAASSRRSRARSSRGPTGSGPCPRVSGGRSCSRSTAPATASSTATTTSLCARKGRHGGGLCGSRSCLRPTGPRGSSLFPRASSCSASSSVPATRWS
jgi:hypothetical protein